jgi:hypothetical protein
MANDIAGMMEQLRQDIARWKDELARLDGDSHAAVIARVEQLIADGEKVLARWDIRS